MSIDVPGFEEEEEEEENCIFTLAFLNWKPWSPERKENVKRIRVDGWVSYVPCTTVVMRPRTPAEEIGGNMSLWTTFMVRLEMGST